MYDAIVYAIAAFCSFFWLLECMENPKTTGWAAIRGLTSIFLTIGFGVAAVIEIGRAILIVLK